MGIFDFFRRPRQSASLPPPASPPTPSRPAAQPIDAPDALRDALMASVRANDADRFNALCAANRAAIDAHSASWRRNDALKNNPDRAFLNDYVNTLIATAQALRSRGHPQLLDALMEKPDDAPLARCNQQMADAGQHIQDGRYQEAIEVAESLLIETRKLQGPGADHYQAMAHGVIGNCRFATGDVSAAISHHQHALRLCEAAGIEPATEGIGVYLKSLAESHRYLGEAAAAADYFDRAAEHFDGRSRPDDAAECRRRSAACRAGEPPLRVLAKIGERTHEIDEAVDARNAHVQFIFERNRPTLPASARLTQEGVRQAMSGDLDAALAILRDAARADPFNPAAHTALAQTLMLKELPIEAIDSYEKAEEVAPGWFQVRADLWLARRIAAGTLPHEVYVLLLAAEDKRFDETQAVAVADRVLALAGNDFAPGHLARAAALQRAKRPAEAIESLQAALACADEPDVKTRALLQLGLATEDAAGRRGLLARAAELNGNPLAAATAKFVLRNTNA